MRFIDSHQDLTQEDGLLELTRFLAEQPGVAGSKLSQDGSVWAVFDDGQLLVFANNRSLGSLLPKETEALLFQASSQLPQSQLMHLANTFSGNSIFRSPVDELDKAARLSGYQVSQGGHVEQFRLLKSIGSLYIDAHGASSAAASSNGDRFPLRGLTLRQPPPDSFAIWTETVANEELDLRYQVELEDQSLIHFIAPVDDESYERRYGITGKFVQENWTFSPHSLVFVNACSSDNSAFRQACLQVGSSAYLGWTTTVGDTVAFKAAVTLFARLFPGEHDPEVSTIQEAFAVLESLGENLDQDTGAQLRLTTTPQFGLLVPSIRSLEVVGQKLEVRGFFGTTVGEVLIDGLSQSLSGPWTGTFLSLSLPDEGSQLQVRVGGRLSNSVAIPRPSRPLPETYQMVASGNLIGLNADHPMFNQRMQLRVKFEGGELVEGDFGGGMIGRVRFPYPSEYTTASIQNRVLTFANAPPPGWDLWNGSINLPSSIPGTPFAGTFTFHNPLNAGSGTYQVEFDRTFFEDADGFPL